LRLDLNLTFITNFFAKQSVDVDSYIIYSEGKEVFYRIKNNKYDIDSHTKIVNGITIETGRDSYIAFYIRREGVYYLYPDSTLYIEKIESFNKEKSIKETHLILEKGRGYFNLNLFSDNSVVFIETDTIFLLVNRAEFIIDKLNNFNTLLSCYNGSLYFRPFSTKFELLKKKRIFNITDSVERLINYSNILEKNEKVLIDYEMCKDLDKLLSRIYESRNPSILNKEYITKNLLISKSYISKEEIVKPDIDFDETAIDMYGYLALNVPNIRYNLFFNDKELRNNSRYIFFLKEGIYNIRSDISFSTVIEYLSVRKSTTQNFYINNYSGIIDFFVNNKRVNFNILNPQDIKEYFTPLYLKNNNFQIIQFETQENINSIYIKSDLDIKGVHLFKNIITNSNEYILENNEKKYYSFPVEISNSNEIFIDKIDFEFNKEIILVEYYNRYQTKY